MAFQTLYSMNWYEYLGNAHKFSDSEQISRTDERRLLQMREQLSGSWMEATAREDPSFTCPNRVDVHSLQH